jgi:hypothetical protein
MTCCDAITWAVVVAVIGAALYVSPDFIGWLQFAWYCRNGCAASFGG